MMEKNNDNGNGNFWGDIFKQLKWDLYEKHIPESERFRRGRGSWARNSPEMKEYFDRNGIDYKK